jgi:hypothetical protein
MRDRPIEDNDIPPEVAFSKSRGLHHIPAGAKVLMPVSIDKSVWSYVMLKALRPEVNDDSRA